MGPLIFFMEDHLETVTPEVVTPEVDPAKSEEGLLIAIGSAIQDYLKALIVIVINDEAANASRGCPNDKDASN